MKTRNLSGTDGHFRDLPTTAVDGSAASSSRLRWISQLPRIVTGVVLVALLAGAITFIAIQRTRHHHTSGPQPTAQPSTAPISIGVAIPGCYNRSTPPADRPAKLNIVGCGSTAVALQDMSWTSWWPQGADGTGIAVFKVCEPTCANGSQLTELVVVHAWNPQPPRANSGCPVGLNIFADMILAFPKGVPPPTTQKVNTQYNGMPAVHYANYPPANQTSPGDAQFIGYTFCS